MFGLFFGEFAAPFSIAGDIYIGLLQMTVLPYIMFSLMANLGRINWVDSRGFLLVATAVLGVLLLIGAVVLLFVPLAYPFPNLGTFVILTKPRWSIGRDVLGWIE